MTSRAEVERVLDATPASNGVAVMDADLRLLAERPPLPGGGFTVVVLGVEPHSYPNPRPTLPCDARLRRQVGDLPGHGPLTQTQRVEPASLGNPPPAPDTGSYGPEVL